MARALLVVATIAAVLVVLPAAAQDEEMIYEEAEESPMIEATPMPANTPVPAATATPLPGPGAVLLSDNFDDPSRAQLPISSDDQESQGYVSGEYEIINGRAELNSLSDVLVPGRYSDSSTSIDARITGGTQGRRAVGLTCRQEAGSYGMDVYPDDQRVHLFWRQPNVPGTNTFIDNRSISAIRTGDAVNRLELACVGSVIAASVNGVVVGSVNDTRYTSGRHRIVVRGSGARARFDNLVVTQR
jgi:hypothetical protein